MMGLSDGLGEVRCVALSSLRVCHRCGKRWSVIGEGECYSFCSHLPGLWSPLLEARAQPSASVRREPSMEGGPGIWPLQM